MVSSPHSRWKKRSLDALFLLFAIALALSFPQTSLPGLRTHYLGHYQAGDSDLSVEPLDVMVNVVVAGWLKFSIVELGQWPHSESPYLIYPTGTSHGRAFDGLMLAILVSALWCVFPLPLAYNISALLGLVMCGFVCYRFAVRRWGQGLSAFATGIMAETMPYLLARLDHHPNLLYIWTIPLALHLFLNFRAKPTWKRCAVFSFSLPLLALSSWYNLVAGMLMLACASLSILFEKPQGDRMKIAGRLAVGWMLGFGMVFLVGWRMILNPASQGGYALSTLAEYSTPLIQYFLPFPKYSYAGQWRFFDQLHHDVGTLFEGYAGGPVLCYALFAVYLVCRKTKGPKLLLLLTAGAGLLLSLGPWLQTVRVLPPEQGVRLPLYYLCGLSDAFRAVKAPGRMHILVNFAALFGTGWLLQSWAKAYCTGRGQRVIYALSVGLLVAVNTIWSVRFCSLPVFPEPRVPAFYETLSRQKGKGAILDVPLSYGYFPRYSFYQLTHKRPIVSSSVFHGAEGKARSFVADNPALRFFWFDHNQECVNEETAKAIMAPSFMKDLAGSGIEYLIVHPRYLKWSLSVSAPPGLGEYYARIEASWKERLVYQDEEIRVYAVSR